MNKDSLKIYFLNGESSEEFVATFIWALIGLLFSMFIELIASTKIKRTGGFVFGFWLKDNIIRMIVSLFAIFIGSAFGDMITGQIPNVAALLIGFFTDKSIEALIKFKKKVNLINVFTIFKKD